MYNGQFVKAFAHVVIFVMLIIAANNIHWAFGWMIAFFIFYMAFEAYKTAEAKRHGLPAPDPLGLDKMFGIQESQIHSTGVPPIVNTAAAYPPVPPQAHRQLRRCRLSRRHRRRRTTLLSAPLS